LEKEHWGREKHVEFLLKEGTNPAVRSENVAK
jgi:hypothetical protein